MAEDAVNYLKRLKESIEEIPDETHVKSIADAVSKKILDELKRYS